jgi:tetratricopeptide (TPR) repeat protein
VGSVRTAVWLVLILLSSAFLSGQDAAPGASVVLVKGEIEHGHWQSGSGVVVAPGIVATNAHVLRGTNRIVVRKEERSWPAILIRLDEERDLALLQVAGMNLTPARIAAAGELQVGQRVIAIGFPGGLESIRRQGALTALWNFHGGKLLQTDAPIAPGSSGGGLFAHDGSLLGITAFAFPVGFRFSFAIPAYWAVELLEEINPAPARRQDKDFRERIFIEIMIKDPANAEALEAFTREWIAAAPGDPEAWFARSHALDQRLRDQASRGNLDAGMLEEGMRASRRVLELKPEHARAWNNLGVALDLKNDLANAETAFQRAVDLNPGYGLAWLNLGGVRLSRRDWTGALQVFLRALELVPDSATGWARRAYTEGMLGRWSESAEHYRVALRYQPLRLDLWMDLRQACLKANNRECTRLAEDRVAALSAGKKGD